MSIPVFQIRKPTMSFSAPAGFFLGMFPLALKSEVVLAS